MVEEIVRLNQQTLNSMEATTSNQVKWACQLELVVSDLTSLTGPLLAREAENHLNQLKHLEFYIEVTAQSLSESKANLAECRQIANDSIAYIKPYKGIFAKDTYQKLMEFFQHNPQNLKNTLMVMEYTRQKQIETSRNSIKTYIRLGIPDFKHHDDSFDGFDVDVNLGEGSSGYVEKVSMKHNDNNDKEHTSYARKFILPIEGAFDVLTKEYWILKDIDKLLAPQNSFFVNVKEAYTVGLDTKNPQFFLVMYPVANGGNLTKYLQKSSPPAEELFQVMGRLVVGLAILHKAGIQHHDIHPGNILIHDGFPLYTDFGLAYSFKFPWNSKTRDTLHRHHCNFAAPENEQDTKSDVFALGGVLYEIAAFLATKGSGMLDCRATESDIRFGNEKQSHQARECLRKEVERSVSQGVKIWLRAIFRMLSIEPDSRPTAMETILTIKEEFKLTSLNTPFCAKCEDVINTLDREVLEPQLTTLNGIA